MKCPLNNVFSLKFILILTISALLLSSCTYIRDLQIVCKNKKGITAVNPTAIPAAVAQSFINYYPAVKEEKWFKFDAKTYASVQKKGMQLFNIDGTKFQDIKMDTIPYGVLELFTVKYPGLSYRRCYKITRYSYAVLFDKDNSPNLEFYHYRSSGIDEEHYYGENSDVSLDNQDLWWDNDNVDVK